MRQVSHMIDSHVEEGGKVPEAVYDWLVVELSWANSRTLRDY